MPEEIPALVARAGRDLGSPAEARLLLAHVLGVDTRRLLLAPAPDSAQVDAFAALVARRSAGVPLQHLTGRAPFRHVEVEVGPGVFIPRPETEVMTGWALDRLAELAASGPAEPVVVELCAGSGAITKALVNENPDATYHCVEVSADAWPYLRRNLAGLPVDARLGDMAEAFHDLDGGVDLVIANPPYVPLEHWADVPAEVRDFDPTLALVSGVDGLDALRVVADVAARLLRPGGWVCAEHAEVQQEPVQALFVARRAFRNVADHLDLTGRPRFVTARRAGRMGA
ncbi:MAG: peptide chain release factor N(5)-glutamine methyltransferase [Actinomycetes bacterium]